VEQSRRFHQALVNAGANSEYLETAGDHVFVGAAVLPEVIERSLDFLRKHRGVGPFTDLDPDIAQTEQLMATAGQFPNFPPAGQPGDLALARARGAKLHDTFYPIIRLCPSTGDDDVPVGRTPPEECRPLTRIPSPTHHR
jgi:hypothetical protein